MAHDCNLEHTNLCPPRPTPYTWPRRLKWVIQNSFLIYEKNPIAWEYFRSQDSIEREKRRQFYSRYRYVIHPLSRLRAYYDMYVIFLYSNILTWKGIDVAFAGGKDLGVVVNSLMTIFNYLSCLDIIINLFLGYIQRRQRSFELRLWKTIAHYVFGPFFICDVISSIPATYIRSLVTHTHFQTTIDILQMFKFVRLYTLIVALHNVAKYIGIKAKGKVFFVTFVTVTLAITHWMACIQFGIARLRKLIFGEYHHRSWVVRGQYADKPIYTQYFQAFFQSIAYMLGVYLDFGDPENIEETVLAIMNYTIGKLIVCTMCIVLMSNILSGKSMDIRFQEMMSQLEGYMEIKQLPKSLRERMRQYYIFKYNKKYLNENTIHDILSPRLGVEVDVHTCQTLIRKVSLFASLDPQAVSDVVSALMPEIFLPNDIIIQSGSYGDCVYFLGSGTVAVYTHSGKEVCHLHDGSYFGEISLLLKGQKRSATVIAIEYCKLYKLKRNDFEKCLIKNATVFKKLLSECEMRLKETKRIEEELLKKYTLDESMHIS